jgi:ssRNA-specific RNase YbeY (16S rRNA maturation enzyme)
VAEKALAAGNADPDSEIGLVITGQETIRDLNRQYRGKDEPTDVLSFLGYSGDIIPIISLFFIGLPEFPQAGGCGRR